ncbi:MAG: polymer-forming cytoskeletal protein [Acidobacteria bacterium]|jgi:cytoskeletal protein CcmA (bactofilin family)|nr:polymer-forming cytoskeletal protein [Acidobacteriota bacterium]
MAKNETFAKVNGFIDKDTQINGEIRFRDSFRIDGKFSGKILSGHSLIIGETGEMEADIDVGHISINGRVKGNLKASELIEIFSQGRVIGQIVTPKLIIEEGAFFQGSCMMELKALESKESKEGRTNDDDNEIVVKSFD